LAKPSKSPKPLKPGPQKPRVAVKQNYSISTVLVRQATAGI
jgi:hypothetical protein